jgi:hypothetical protein
MRRVSRLVLCVSMPCALAAGSGCDDGGSSARDSTSRTTRAGPDAPLSVGCSAAITNRVDPRWRRRSVVAGRVGLYGDASDARKAYPWGRSAFWTKIPVIVAGHRPATVRIRPRDRHRIGLTYGPRPSTPASSRNGARGLAAAPREVRFLPCRDRATTAWPGGLALADRRGVTLQVRLAGQPWRSLSIPVRG